MNLTQRPQPNALATPVAPRRAAHLSARQLFDVELGLCLLAQLSPSASPSALPALLLADNPAEAVRTAKQRRCLDKARLLLVQIAQPSRPGGINSPWVDLLDRYVRLPDHMQAFDISRDRSRFSPKTVGFFRNRVRTLNHLLA